MTRTQLIRKLATAALIASSATPSYSAIFDQDDRQYVLPTSGSPYSPVGLVTRGLLTRTVTTGFLVDDCHVLTSQIVTGYGEAPFGKRLKFQTGIGTADYQSTRATVIAAGGINRHDTIKERYESGPRGWLLLRLDRCIGARLGHVKLKTGPFSPDEFRNLQSAGYPVHRSREKGLTVDPACSVYFGYGPIWFNDCATVAADGGDPIFRISSGEGKPQMEVYAIQLYGFFKGRHPIARIPGRENEAVAMAQLAPQILPYLSLSNREGSGVAKAAESKPTHALSKVRGSTGVSFDGNMLDARVVTANYRASSPSSAR